MARVSTLEVIIEGDASRLVGALNSGAKATQGFGTKVSATSKTTGSMFNALGLGAAAAGFAVAAFAKRSVQAAMDYDRAFTRIAAVTNTSSAAIEGMKAGVMSLAHETAQAPVALADALYFLSSAGLDAAQVQETLKMAAEGAAVGLGTAADTSRLTASALVAFAKDGLTATQVFDTLTAAIREGNAEPAEFADALGRVMPIAAEVGITFDQVTASLAAMSKSGLDVNEGVTALRGILSSLAAPTKQTQDALAAIGMTADDVRASLAEQGLIGTLRMLEDATGGNIDQMKLLVPNVRALTGVLNLTGQSAESVDEVFQRVLNSTGDMAEAFRVTSESDAFKIQQALNDLNIAGQKLAAQVLPLLAESLGVAVEATGPFIEDLASISDLLDRIRGASSSSGGGMSAFGRAVELTLNPTAAFKGIVGDAQAKAEELGRTMGSIPAAAQAFANTVQGQLVAALDRLRVHITATGTKIINFARMTGEELSKWKTDTIKTFTDTFNTIDGAEDVFSGTVDKFIKDAQRAAQQAMRAALDMKVLSNLDIGLNPSERDAFMRWLVDGGPNAIDKFVRASQDGRDKLIEVFRQETAATGIRNSSLDKLTKPRVVKVTADTASATNTLVNLQAYLASIVGRSWKVQVGVHTGPESPWPDEALKARLTDPMKRMGFLKVAGRWTLPLDVKVHTAADATNWTQQAELRAVDFAARNASGAGTHTPRFDAASRPPRLPTTIRLDRKRFSDELSYDAAYRGW